ncbi:MAG: DUF4920 domain-containing protein [Chitinophagales bacterium]
MLQKKSILFFLTAVLIIGCNNNSTSPNEPSGAVQLVDGIQHFGEKIDESGALSLDNLLSKVSTSSDAGSMKVKTTGEVEAVCQVKGCWMTLKKPDGNVMRVTFKDYGFFMPTDIAGKTVVVEGEAKVDTTTVEMLRHYAEDEGLAQEEIDKITEPEIDVTFIADGVILKDK